MPHKYSPEALRLRRERAIDRKFLRPGKFVAVPPSVPKETVKTVVSSLDLHASHDVLTGKAHHSAWMATAAARNVIGHSASNRAQKIHKMAGMAKHGVGRSAIRWHDLVDDGSTCNDAMSIGASNSGVGHFPDASSSDSSGSALSGARSLNCDLNREEKGDTMEHWMPTDGYFHGNGNLATEGSWSKEGGTASPSTTVDGAAIRDAGVDSMLVKALDANKDLASKVATLQDRCAELEAYAFQLEWYSWQQWQLASVPWGDDQTADDLIAAGDKLDGFGNRLGALEKQIDKMAGSLGDAVQQSIDIRIEKLDGTFVKASSIKETVDTAIGKQVEGHLTHVFDRYTSKQSELFSMRDAGLKELFAEVDSKIISASSKSQGTFDQLKAEVCNLEAKLAGLAEREGEQQPVTKKTQHIQGRLPIGTAVLTHSLKTIALNNKVGTIVSFDVEKSRYGVRFVESRTEEAPKLLKRSNLTIQESSTKFDSGEQDDIDKLIVGQGEDRESTSYNSKCSSSGRAGDGKKLGGGGGEGQVRGGQSSISRGSRNDSDSQVTSFSKPFGPCGVAATAVAEDDDEEPWVL